MRSLVGGNPAAVASLQVQPRPTPAERADLEEQDGIAKTVRLTPNGLDVELFHILTFT